MKVLFIGSRRHDYVQDLLYSGLVKILGLKNVVELYWNYKYHVPVKQYPKNMGYVKKSFFVSKFQSANNIDLVIVGAAKPDCFKLYLKHLPNISPSVPVVFIDGGDRPEVAGDLSRYEVPELYQKATSIRPFDFIFKREMLKEKKYESNVIPLTIAFNFSFKPKLKLSHIYDVAFWAGNSHEQRAKAKKLLDKQFDCEKNGTTSNENLNSFSRKGNFYLEELGRCKINISIRGGGNDTLRYWEVPAVESMLLSERLDIIIPNDFTHEKNAIFCNSDLSDMIDLCEYWLKNENKRTAVAKAGYEHMLRYHTDTHRAQTVLDTVKHLL